MPDSYICYNSNISVSNVKISKTITNSASHFNEISDLDDNTILLSDFSSSVDAWYFNQSGTNNSPFFIYRKRPEQQYYDYLGQTQKGQNAFTDYNVKNNTKYHYLISTKSPDGSGKYIVYENLNEDHESPEYKEDGELHYLKTAWTEWSICSIAETDKENEYKVVSDRVWLLGGNLESGDIVQNTSVTSWNTLGQYAKVSVGSSNFDSGSITCLLGAIGYSGINSYKETYTDLNTSLEKDMIESWKKFVDDKSLKLLKDRKGQKWIIQILGNSTRKIKDETSNQMTVISFQWQEVTDSNKASIIKSYLK